MSLPDHPVGGPGRSGGGPAHRRTVPVAERRRRMWLVSAGVLAAALLGLAVWLVLVAGADSAGGDPASAAAQPTEASGSAQPTGATGLPPLPASAGAPDEQLRVTIADLEGLVQRNPAAVGPEAPAVLERLRQVELLDGGPQRSAALAAQDAVGAAVAGGGLADAVGQQVQDVLAAVARPDRLIDLVETVGADPAAIGPAGPELLDPLSALDHEVPADETAARAADLLADVQAAAESGEVSRAFAAVAVPTLQELADPGPHRALQDLLADAERDPEAIGPAQRQVLASLRAIAQLPVYPQGNEVAALLELVRGADRVTPAFRDAAVPVLVPMLR